LALTFYSFFHRWGDPVRTLAAALFLDKSQVHFFDQVGYDNDDISHCPFNSHSSQQCTCNAAQSHGKQIHATCQTPTSGHLNISADF
jgi:alpha 1,2-mannosyltransferase